MSKRKWSKLTEEQVQLIRYDTRSSSLVARDYGVDAGLIRAIWLGRRWPDVDPPIRMVKTEKVKERAVKPRFCRCCGEVH